MRQVVLLTFLSCLGKIMNHPSVSHLRWNFTLLPLRLVEMMI